MSRLPVWTTSVEWKGHPFCKSRPGWHLLVVPPVNWGEWKCQRHFFGVSGADINHQNSRRPIIHISKWALLGVWICWKMTNLMKMYEFDDGSDHEPHVAEGWYVCYVVSCGLMCYVVSFGHKPLDISNGCHSCGWNPICRKILQETVRYFLFRAAVVTSRLLAVKPQNRCFGFSQMLLFKRSVILTGAAETWRR